MQVAKSRNPVVRNNALIVLCDLCVKYTSLIDRHIPRIALCLKDPSEIVRVTAVTLLTNLIRTEYVKWKDALFFRFVAGLVDDSANVRDLVRESLELVLIPKMPALCSLHFVETVFVLNGETSHPQYNKFPPTGDGEEAKFVFNGMDKSAIERRQTIYNFLLAHCSDEQRFGLSASLVESVLGSAVDGSLNVATAQGVIADTLILLSGKEIRVGRKTKTTGAVILDLVIFLFLFFEVFDAFKRKNLVFVQS